MFVVVITDSGVIVDTHVADMLQYEAEDGANGTHVTFSCPQGYLVTPKNASEVYLTKEILGSQLPQCEGKYLLD